jgi:hypothetical protein
MWYCFIDFHDSFIMHFLLQPFFVENSFFGGEAFVPVAFRATDVQQLTRAPHQRTAHTVRPLQPFLFLQHQTAMRNGTGVLGSESRA